MGQFISLTAADGNILSAYTAGEPSSLAGVVILQEIFGVNAHIRSVADEYASQGFYVVAPALFDRVERGAEIDHTPEGVERARALAARLSPETVIEDIAAAIAHVRVSVRSHRVGVVGYCLGGSYAWLSATRLTADAAVGYYGSKVSTYLDEKPLVPVILHYGDKDRGIPLADVEKIKAAHPLVPVYIYDAGHGFNRPGGVSFSAAAATLAFERTLGFLRTHLKSENNPG